MMETLFIVLLFTLYLALWARKRLSMKRRLGIDPQVIGRSSSPLQRYMNALMFLLMLYLTALIPFHALEFEFFSLFTRFAVLEARVFDYLGFSLGLAGLSICLYAQMKMGGSWRVGIDETMKTNLITTGLYSVIRNPTYLGLFFVNLGVWLIWPTLTVFLFNLVFILFLEIQVRCEEEFLERAFGDEYRTYSSKTKRYFPFLY